MTVKNGNKRTKKEVIESLQDQMTEREREEVNAVIKAFELDPKDPIFDVMTVLLNCRQIFERFDQNTKRSMGRVQSLVAQLETLHNTINEDLEATRETLRSSANRVESRNKALESQIDKCMSQMNNAMTAMGYRTTSEKTEELVLPKQTRNVITAGKQIAIIAIAFILGGVLVIGCNAVLNDDGYKPPQQEIPK